MGNMGTPNAPNRSLHYWIWRRGPTPQCSRSDSWRQIVSDLPGTTQRLRLHSEDWSSYIPLVMTNMSNMSNVSNMSNMSNMSGILLWFNGIYSDLIELIVISWRFYGDLLGYGPLVMTHSYTIALEHGPVEILSFPKYYSIFLLC